MNMPSARTLPAGSLAFHWSRAQPYFRGSIVGYPFDWFEALYKYTDINDRPYSPYANFSGGQSLKDKAFDVKFVLIKENNFLPQIAFGIRDLGGTNRFAAEYLVASKYIGNFDFSVGAGWGTLASPRNSITNPMTKIADSFNVRGNSGEQGTGGSISTDAWLSGKKISIFGGFEYFVPRFQGLRVKLEYDTTNYKYPGSEGERVVKQDSPYNLGMVYAASRNLKLHLGAIRGNTIQVGFTYSGLYGKKDPLKIKNDPIKNVPNSEIFRQVTENDNRALYLTALKYLAENQIYIQSAELQEDTLHVAYAQPVHQSYIRAAGRAASILDQVSPKNVTNFKLSSMNVASMMHTIEIPRQAFHVGKKNNDFESVAYVSKIYNQGEDFKDLEFQPLAKFPVHKYSFAPALRNHIGGPDGFYFGELYLRANSQLTLSRNLTLTTSAGVTLADSFDNLRLPSDSILPHVRTDIVDYLKGGRGFSISRMQFDYIVNPRPSLYMKLSAGIFEEMFGGAGAALLYRPFKSSLAFGIEATHAQQREFDQRFDFKDYDIVTGHVSMYYRHNPTGVLTTLRGGRYLAGDSGFTLDFSRKFKSGLYMGAFFSLTDISKEEFGEGSFDKGFYFSFPLEIFNTKYGTSRSYFGLKPLTRDGAAYLIKAFDLYGVSDQADYHSISKDWDDLYD